MPEIAVIKTSEYAHLPLVQDRSGPSDTEQAIIRQAIQQRANTNLPFWDSVMLSVAHSENPVDWLLDTASTHISLRGEERTITVDAVGKGELQKLLEQTNAGREICVLSEISTNDGSIKHIPMIDFHCPPSKSGRRAVVAVCKRLFPSGAILLESGESFHAYGRELIPADAFFTFLGHALLYSPIIDRAYIAHQLIERRCALRISGKKKPTPITIEII